MGELVTALIAKTAAFIATNVDDIFILVLFFSQVDETFRPRHVVAGQYLGFAAIVVISALGLLGALVVPPAYIGLLGFVPIAMGARRLLRRAPEEGLQQELADRLLPPRAGRAPLVTLFDPRTHGVAAVTFANGGDNIAIYIPLFAAGGVERLALILLLFAILIAVWCYAGYFLANHPHVAGTIDLYGHIIVPFVLVGLGVFILIENSTAALLLQR